MNFRGFEISKKLIILLAVALYLCLALLATTVEAAHGNQEPPFFSGQEEGEPIHYELRSNVTSVLDPPPGELVNFTYPNFPGHNYQVLNHTVRITIHQTASYQEDNTGVWLLEAFNDGEKIPGCDWRIETQDPGVLGGNQVFIFTNVIRCEINGDLADGNHTITIVRSLESGNPADIDNNVISTAIHRQDLVLVSQPTDFEASLNLTALEFLGIVALAALGVILWSRSLDPIVRLSGGGMVIAGGLLALNLQEGNEPLIYLAVMLLLVGAYLWLRFFLDALTDSKLLDK